MEKQKQTRRPKRIEVRYGVDRPTHLGFTIDLSATGLFIKSATVHPPGTPLRLELTLPNRRVIELRGTVSWVKQVPRQLAPHVKKAGMGIVLVDPPAEYVELVRDLGCHAGAAHARG